MLFLLGLGATVELPNAVGWIPIHQACRFGHIDVVRLLSRQKAGLQRITAFGASCIALAVCGGHLEVGRPPIKILITYHAIIPMLFIIQILVD